MTFELKPKMSKGQLVTNAQTLVKEVEKELEKYQYVVTEQNYELAKSDRTNLNKLVKEISDKRKEIEKDVFGNWNEDKKTIMSLEKKIKELSSNLGEGINGVDQIAKDEKLEKIKKAWESESKDLQINVSFDLVFDKRWLNKTTTMNEIASDMYHAIKKVNDDLTMLERFFPEDEFEKEQVLMKYEQTLDVKEAIAKADELKALREKVNEMAKKKTDVEPEQEQICFGNPESNSWYEEPKEEVQEKEVIRYAKFEIEGPESAFRILNANLPALLKQWGITFKVTEKGVK